MDNEEQISEVTEVPGKLPFVHLHNHTDYSLLDGAGSIARYMEKAKKMGMDALAITDHGNMYGALRFYDACRNNEIKPIIGCEFYMNPKDRKDRSPMQGGSRYYHLILLAMNDEGYHRLMELNTISFTEGYYYKPRIDDEVLVSHSDNLICLSACLGGEILQHLLNDQYELAKERALWFKGVFGDRYYLELQDHGLEEQKRTNPLLVKLAKELDIPLVCTNDCHYIDREDADAHDALLCIGTGRKKNEENRMRFPNDNFYFKSGEEMEEIFSWCPEAIENTHKIADRINIEIKKPGPLLPVYQLPEGFTDPKVYLTYLANEGLKERYGTVTDELQKRLDYELGIILHMDFQGYFLIVRDYIHWAKMHGIPVGPGRGSGAGSLVAYAITITDVDPMKYNLLFERFLNPERVSMPDFDIDFCFERRGEVIEYVTEHYGKDRVGQICTFGTLKTKAVVKDVARVLDIPYDESNAICKLIPDDDPKITLPKALEREPKLRELEERGGVYKQLFDISRKLEGLNRHTSLHAAGVVIGQEPLINYVPLCCDPKTGAVSTQYTMDQIEPCGLVKMDFLGLKTLTLIKHTVDLIKKINPDFDINKIDEEDPKTFDMLCRGDSACVFQFESAGMQKILREAAPHNIEDIVALNALYRPGPMAYIPQYIDCKLGKKPIEYADPELEPVLKNTYGVIVYQEQVMQVAQIIAGYTLGEADILRRIMGKKKVYELANQKVKFLAGAEKLGRSRQHADDIFEMLAPFAQYGFNKSHAVAYSIVAYQTAFLKANYPAEFLAANLTNEINNPEKFTEYLSLADTMNIKLLPPDVNYSDVHFNVVDGNIVYGLSGIKNVGEGVMREIINEREKNGPYKDFINFLSRQSEGTLNSRLLEALIKAGAFDSMGVNRATLMANLEDALNFDKAAKSLTAYGQISLFGDEDESMNQFEMRPVEDWSQTEKLTHEKELLGFYLSGHPLDKYKEDSERAVWVNVGIPKELPVGRTVNLIAMVTAERTIVTKKGTKMGIYTLTTKNGNIDAVAFPKIYEEEGEKLHTDTIWGLTGKFDNARDPEVYQFVIETVVEPSKLSSDNIKQVMIDLNEAEMDKLDDLRVYMINNQGSLPVFLSVGDSKWKVKCSQDFGLTYSKGLKAELAEFPVVNRVWYN
jgi:DNA-directed DNA polymerase III (polc)